MWGLYIHLHGWRAKGSRFLNEELQNAFKQEGALARWMGLPLSGSAMPIFIRSWMRWSKTYEALLSMACGAGVQFLADRYPEKTGLPGFEYHCSSGWTGISDGLRRIAAPAGNAFWRTQRGICPVQDVPRAFSTGPAEEPPEKVNVK